MLELDQVVRQNQLACLPYGKSRKAEEELFSTYPDLQSLIEKNRQAKFDSMALNSRSHDGDTHPDSSLRSEDDAGVKSRSVIPILKSHQSGLIQDQKNQIKGPLLGSNSSARNLMFEMDEELSHMDEVDEAKSPLSDRVEDMSNIVRQAAAMKIPGSNEGSIPGSDISLGGNKTPIISASSSLVDAQYPSSDFDGESYEHRPSSSGDKTPWNYPTASPKSDMKLIMAQASMNRPSNASSSLLSPVQAASGSLARLSQRERKKRQHEQQQQQQQQQEHQQQAELSEIQQSIPGSSSPVIAPTPPVETIPISPWQVPSPATKISLEEVLRAESNSVSPSNRRKSSRASSSSTLTLRQTVSGNSPSAQRTFGATGGSQEDFLPTRSESSRTHSLPSNNPQHSTSNPPSRSISTNPSLLSPALATSIQSIRHQPPVAEPSLQLSMADILALQQSEKDIIKEAAVKRSLQDIQEEQAFQEWWDQESRRVMEKEEIAGQRQRTDAGRGGERGTAREKAQRGGGRDGNGKGSVGDGSGRRGRSMRGSRDDREGGAGGAGGRSGPNEGREAGPSSPSPSSSSNRGRGTRSRGPGRGRARGRGRGRGAVQSDAR